MGKFGAVDMRVAVASHNPVKIESVRKAFASVWEGSVEIVACTVDSTKDQPFDDETPRGAKQRALEALKTTLADLGVGLEGGIDRRPEGYFVTGWCAIADPAGKVTYGRSFGVPIPAYVVDRMKNEGKELGDVVDVLLGRKNTKQAEGFFGFATKNVITREKGYIDMVVAALAPRVFPEFYNG
ncbi:MAG: inosine/xanthosine triphosphatase [Parcubacteria group bacterium]